MEKCCKACLLGWRVVLHIHVCYFITQDWNAPVKYIKMKKFEMLKSGFLVSFIIFIPIFTVMTLSRAHVKLFLCFTQEFTFID